METGRVFGRVGFLLLAVGFIVLGMCLYSSFQNWQLLAASQRVTGVVETVEPPANRPVVTFSTSAEEQVQFTDSVGSRRPRYAAGDEIEVIYDPADPADAHIYSFSAFWSLPLIAGFISLCMLLVGSGFTWASRSIARERSSSGDDLYRRHEAIPVAQPVEHPTIDAPTLAQIQELLARGNKIQAIKVYRTATRVGLKEALNAVEAIQATRP